MEGRGYGSTCPGELDPPFRVVRLQKTYLQAMGEHLDYNNLTRLQGFL